MVTSTNSGVIKSWTNLWGSHHLTLKEFFEWATEIDKFDNLIEKKKKRKGTAPPPRKIVPEL